jgi:exosortase E/protease (VPEID-CTERM system)
MGLGVLAALSRLSFETAPPGPIDAVRVVLGIAAALCAGFACIPLKLALEFLRKTALLWIYSLAAGTLATWLIGLSSVFGQASIRLTLVTVGPILRLLLSNVVCDPVNRIVGTTRFNAVMETPCSGVEGVGLVLAFSVAWLWAFRRECRFPRALLLIPAGVITIWLANAFRIVALIMIGNAGLPDIALGGFHSQAGWIAFNGVALGFCVLAQRSSWFAVAQVPATTDAANGTAAYLVPFLGILAAGMLARSVSASFEWLYPLRFFAALAALWYYRSAYAGLDWRFGWRSLGIGTFVFVLWMAFDRIFASTPPDQSMAAALSAVPASVRIAWLTIRVLAAIVTVPVAEELAFRGFLIRRLKSRDFESLSPRTFDFLGVLVSSVVFGMLHGGRWLAGILAGLCYAYAMLRRGRIGDAVAAHATTNALIAISVLLQGRWDLW